MSISDRFMDTYNFEESKKHFLAEETCDDLPLRSGKWTHEEERYAASLIEHFESGKLTDCEEGETLRAYLSRKLHCIPMRVSKKYAGQCIGKHTFRVAYDDARARHIPVLVCMRDEFLRSVNRKKQKNQDNSPDDLLDGATNTEFEQYLSATDAANSESSDEDIKEEARRHPLKHTFSFVDVNDDTLEGPSGSTSFGANFAPSISNKQDSFEWVEILSNNMDQF